MNRSTGSLHRWGHTWASGALIGLIVACSGNSNSGPESAGGDTSDVPAVAAGTAGVNATAKAGNDAGGSATGGVTANGGMGGDAKGGDSQGGANNAGGPNVAGSGGSGLGGVPMSGGTGGAGEVPTCRDGVYQGKTYRVCPQAGLDRAAAQAFCAGRGANLVELDDANEEAWLYEYVVETGSIWIGLNDIAQEGEWRWQDGSALGSGYASWASGQPNDSAPGEDCAVLHSGMGEWNDVACDVTAFGSDPLSFVCE